MVKGLRNFCSILAIAPSMAFLPLAVNAAGLPVFNQWSVDNGDINVACPAGFSCEVVSFGDGFTQVQWVDTGDGTTYIQTIITDLGATSPDPSNLNYSDESFVRLGSDNGILSQQRHVQDDALGRFENMSSLQIGWANPTPGAESPHMDINQSFVTEGTGVAGDEFNTSFNMLIIHNEQGAIQDRRITIDQRAGLGDGVVATDDLQRFLLIRNEGAFTTQDGSITLGATSFDGVGTPLNGGTVDWLSGQDVMVRWIGQSIDLDSQGMSLFGFQGVTNFTTDDEATTFSSAATGIDDGEGGFVFPFGWNPTFGPAPSLQDIE
jgi:hypothetical protein